eukprot:TRINITY_DN3_c0_g1_i1.p1 TRINITY_DN3_c0_g1~~TRINITY_DN3_c0_g1_i1.p1  ORF type:complete len:219 (+),score=70.09 TRINITY_DN3_c0_g1_i1:27-659(+)
MAAQALASNLLPTLASLSFHSSSVIGSKLSTSSSSNAVLNRDSLSSLSIECAHKKGSGSTKNGRDSISKRMGVKVYGDQRAIPGSIIIRQRGTKFHPGNNVGMGKDYTIFSLIDGVVKFEKFGAERKKISVYPMEPVAENPESRRVRRREAFRVSRERRRAREEVEFDDDFDLAPLISIADASDASAAPASGESSASMQANGGISESAFC